VESGIRLLRKKARNTPTRAKTPAARRRLLKYLIDS
jgi:hypothetical protein